MIAFKPGDFIKVVVKQYPNNFITGLIIRTYKDLYNKKQCCKILVSKSKGFDRQFAEFYTDDLEQRCITTMLLT